MTDTKTFTWTAKSGVKVVSTVPREAGENYWWDHPVVGGFLSWHKWYKVIMRNFR